jgi:hypothetical protein
MLALTGEETEVVDTVKPALALPAGTITDAGRRAAAELLESATETPPAGAGLDRVTPACNEPPPTTEAELRANPESAGTVAGAGLTVSVAA